MCAESGAEAELEAGLELGEVPLAQPVPGRRHQRSLAHHPSTSGGDQSLSSPCAGTEFLSKDTPWMTAPYEQDQGSGERTGLTSPGLQTTTVMAVRVSLLGWLTVGPTSVFHEDCEAEQSFTSHPSSCSERALHCRCGTAVTVEVPTALLSAESASDTSLAETPLVRGT